MSNFELSQRSKDNLVGVDPNLTKVCKVALSCSDVDFGVSEGLRTIEQQKEYVASGKSQTMNSKHLTGCAIDVYAWVDGVSWDIKYYLKIAEAFRQASIKTGIKIRWGGSWTVLNSVESASEAYHNYVNSKNNPFVDSPHFELYKD